MISGQSRQISGPGALVVGQRIGVVAVLVEEAPVGIGGGHLLRSAHRAVAALLARGQDDLGSEDLQHLASFDRHAGGHEDLDRIALQLGNRGQRDAGVAARRFEDGLAGSQLAGLFRLLDHRLGDAILHRAERVLPLELGDDAHVGIRRQPADVDHRSIADHVEHTFERNHHHPQQPVADRLFRST